MFSQGFTVSGSSLKLLDIGERGVVAALRNPDDGVIRQLRGLGLLPGTLIQLEQRSPQFVVTTESDRITLDDRLIGAVYVRLTNPKTGLDKKR
ncbi:ferrous iron transport protein A [Oscillatoria sp. FACHB-1407]|uniref:FeoA family protein n=1 Tax=Oscillatoria sp. FACHB-1407 TaxID=2692847 RepID=UPI0016870C07|nr:FeoA family protein [Oscillatoria sp. FACHB-1407]MBD2459881.1 ferrous iron transport protein A [Oscillatoria sp. FACHB-1407]